MKSRNIEIIIHRAVFTLLAVFLLSACREKNKPISSPNTIPVPGSKNELGSLNLNIQISLVDSIPEIGEEVLLNIDITNKELLQQKILFDLPSSATFGPWATRGKVINLATGASMLQYDNKRMLESQIYLEEDLAPYYRILEPGQTFHAQYNLRNIVIFNTPEFNLPKGKYSVQLFYFDIPSNTVHFEVR